MRLLLANKHTFLAQVLEWIKKNIYGMNITDSVS